MERPTHAVGFFCALVLTWSTTSWAVGPLQRVPNTSLTNLPARPPQLGFTLDNAFPGLNFSTMPVCIASPPGETNRLFILEKGGNIAVITNLASPTRSVF